MSHKYLIGTLFQQQQQIKKTNINNIKAKDPNGNVRWKGAFTGGFQAGYKNTVGSKEGWVPATFVSSQAKRAQKTQQNITDFMDKEDLGRESISSNIAVKNQFQNTGQNSLNFRVKQSIGQKILQKLKKEDAFEKAPQNIQDLNRLLQKYAKQDAMEVQNTNYQFHLKDIEFHHSIGDYNAQFQDDDFIANYEDFFKKVIRDRVKQQSQEQIAKRRQQNRIYFDFKKPLQEQPQYLKQIQQLSDASKPRKRKKNVINEHSLMTLFSKPMPMKQFKMNQQLEKAPENYDPYYRLRALKQKQRERIKNIGKKEEPHRPKSYNLQKRSEILGQPRLSEKFKSSSFNQTSFIKAGQQSAQNLNKSQLKKFFQDQKKNLRYHDYVMELEGKKITAQFQYQSWQQAQEQKRQFDKVYNLQVETRDQKDDDSKILVTDKANNREVTIFRTINQWKPNRLLCKRFNILFPESS